MRSDYPDVSGASERNQKPPIDPGLYWLKVDNVREEKDDGALLVDKNGNHYTLISFTVDDADGYILYDRFVFDEKYQYHDITMNRFKQMLMALGLPTNGGQWSDLIGRKCRAMVKVKDGYNNIHWYSIEDTPEQGEPRPKKDEDLPF